jgi:hypothetical protein
MFPHAPSSHHRLREYLDALEAVWEIEWELMRRKRALLLVQNKVLATELQALREMFPPCYSYSTHFGVLNTLLTGAHDAAAAQRHENLSAAVRRRVEYNRWDEEELESEERDGQ